jgi:hypothetical protein
MDKELEEKKQRGPLFWIIMIFVLILFLGLCCCGGSIFTASHLLDEEKIHEVFVNEYCDSLDKENRLDEDPFGWCD